MTENRHTMLWAAFAADALSLGSHWVYNTKVIDKKFGRTETLEAPLTSYHKGKHKGDFTHYGDQTLLLLECLTTMPQFDLQGWADAWRRFFDTYAGYVDSATKETLERMVAGEGPATCGSASDDLAGAARIAPLIYAYARQPEALETAVSAATALTHQHPQVIEVARMASRATLRILAGETPLEALQATLAAHAYSAALTDAFEDGVATQAQDTRQVIADFGQMCSVEAALPGVFHLVAKYEGDLKEALIQNVMAGGDNAARGMLAAILLGSHAGSGPLPTAWQDGMAAKERIAAAQQAIDTLR
ncbi:MAG: ADP-ribosylglycohydrolase family protein [Desulfosarcinaceae bacterium]|nr:ADP-ribosylglycohydrolase family protein [Desulfosarcinaceae bacterium]